MTITFKKSKMEIEFEANKIYPTLENLEVTPSAEEQVFNHPNSYGYDKVKVKKVEGETLNVTPAQESQQFKGIYDEINVEPIQGEELNVIPSTEEQINEGVYTKVIINPVTADIDKNIRPEIIQVGNSILGVDGSFEGVDTRDATASSNDVLVGKVAYAKNQKLQGTIEEYDGSYSGNASTTSELEQILINLLDDTQGANTTKLPDSLTEIGSYSFYSHKNLALTKLPDSLTNIGIYAFYGCTNLVLTEIPEGVDGIAQRTFYACENIEELTVKGDITGVGAYAFYNCKKLSKLVLPNITSIPSLGSTNVFQGTPIASGTGYIYVPDSLVDSIKTAKNWTTYANQIKPISEMEG